MCTQIPLTGQHKNSNIHVNDVSHTKSGSSQISNTVFASSTTETPPDTPPDAEPDWSSGDTALEIHFEMKTGKHAFQKTCRDMFAFDASATRKGRKEVLERRMSLEERKQFDPAKQEETKNYIAEDAMGSGVPF